MSDRGAEGGVGEADGEIDTRERVGCKGEEALACGGSDGDEVQVVIGRGFADGADEEGTERSVECWRRGLGTIDPEGWFGQERACDSVGELGFDFDEGVERSWLIGDEAQHAIGEGGASGRGHANAAGDELQARHAEQLCGDRLDAPRQGRIEEGRGGLSHGEGGGAGDLLEGAPRVRSRGDFHVAYLGERLVPRLAAQGNANRVARPRGFRGRLHELFAGGS